MSKYEIRPQFERQNRILNVKIRHAASVRMSNQDFECQNTIYGLITNVKMDFKCQNMIISPILNVKIGFLNVKSR